jgi:hypothetical protein
MATFTKSNSDNFLTWQKVNGALPLSDLQARGIPDCVEGYNIEDVTLRKQIARGINDTSMFWSDDGLNFYYINTSTATLYQKSVSKPYDISTVTSTQSKAITEDTSPFDVRFLNGSACYISGRTNDTIYQYTLGTPWDISTLSYDSKSIDCSSKTVSVQGFSLSSDNVYVSAGSSILQYSIVGGDLSTSVFVSQITFSFTSLIQSIAYRSDAYIYFTDFTQSSIYELSIVSGNIERGKITASQNNNFTTNPLGIHFNEGGFNMWLMDGEQSKISEYFVGCK